VFTARYLLSTQCISVFCVNLRTNSDYFYEKHYVTGFYKRDGVCLLCGTTCPHSLCFYKWAVFLLRGMFCRNNVFRSDYFTVQHYVIGFYNRQRLCLLRGTFCPHSVLMCFVWIWEQTVIISMNSIKWLVFITENECVYYAVRSVHSVFLCLYNRGGVFTALYFLPNNVFMSDYFTVQH
jgi:hypothetical protein